MDADKGTYQQTGWLIHRLLRFALDISWKDHVTNEKLYAGLPKLSDKLRSRRLGIAGHCVRHPEEAAHHTMAHLGEEHPV